MHETRALWLLVPSVTIHLYNDQYTVRLSELTETTVSTPANKLILLPRLRTFPVPRVHHYPHCTPPRAAPVKYAWRVGVGM